MPTQQEALQRWPIMKRSEAHALGHLRYFTGKACRNGHWDQRSVKSGICVACNRMYAQKFRDAGPNAQGSLTVQCHPDDAETVRQFVAGLNVSRELAGALPAADMAATRVAVFPELASAPPGYTPPKPVLR
jgi:hypothetical protein